MSLEQTINENTIAIRDLIAVLKMQGYALASQPGEIPGFDKNAIPLVNESLEVMADAVASSATGANEQDPAPKGETMTLGEATAKHEAQTTAPESKPVEYADAAAAVTKLSRAKGRDAAVALLKSFGAAKLPEVPADKYADVVAAAELALSQDEAA